MEEVWLSSLSKVDEILSEARFCDGILLGMDLNQNLTLKNSAFPALARLRLLLSHRGLEFMHVWETLGKPETNLAVLTGFFSDGP